MLDMFAKGGLLMWPILLCSVVALSIVIHKGIQFSRLLRVVTLTPGEIFSLRPEPLAPLLNAIGKQKSEEDICSVGTGIVRNMERGLGTLSLIAAICPLLGLTGTVIGMIQAFQVIASSNAAANPEMLASGIWEALITTATGLLVAIPVHVAHHYLDSRMGEITYNLQRFASRMTAEQTNAV